MTATLPATTTTVASLVTPPSNSGFGPGSGPGPNHTGRFGQFLDWFNRIPQDGKDKIKSKVSTAGHGKVLTTEVKTVTRSVRRTDVMPTGPRVFERGVAVPTVAAPTVPTPVAVPDVPVSVPDTPDVPVSVLKEKRGFDEDADAAAQKSTAALPLRFGAASTVALSVAMALCMVLVVM